MLTTLVIPRGMRLVPNTGAVVLVDLPDLPAGWRKQRTPDGSTHGERIDAARRALDRLTGCWLPGPAELVDAPILDFEGFVDDGPFVALHGRVYAHPIILRGHRCVTSVLVAYDGRRGLWARTISRWYLVGPAPAEN
jgi:hypothetical protein